MSEPIPPPDLWSWAFWFKDSASVRDLLVALAAPVAFLTAGAALLQTWIAARRHVAQTKADRERRITDNFTRLFLDSGVVDVWT
jgi:hypothetical protein